MVNLTLKILFLVLCNLSTLANAQETPEEWYQRLIESKKIINHNFFPEKIIFVNKLPEKGSAEFRKDIDEKKFNSFGIFKEVDWKTAEWNFTLNKNRYKKSSPIPVIFKFTDADTIIDTSKNWNLYHRSSPEKPILELGKPEDQSVAGISKLLVERLGWDGVILDVKKNSVLVGSTSEILSQPEIQALAIEGSVNKLVVKPENKRGSGLLSLQKFSNGLGIFDVVFLEKGKKNILPGTKLIIERKK